MRQAARLFLQEGRRVHHGDHARGRGADRRRRGARHQPRRDRRGAEGRGVQPRQGAADLGGDRRDPVRDAGDVGAGYFGGFLPFISQLIVAKTGNPYGGLWFTWWVVLVALLVALWGLKWKDEGTPA